MPVKALVPQCAHFITPIEFQKPNITLQLSASNAMNAIITECAPRIHRWKGVIIEALGKCWITLHDIETLNQGDLLCNFYTILEELTFSHTRSTSPTANCGRELPKPC